MELEPWIDHQHQQSLMNMAALPPEKREEWLDFAQCNRLSVGSLRQALRSGIDLPRGSARAS